MNYWDRLEALFHGAAQFRFIVQPVVALLLGMRDGKLDFRMGNRPYLLDVLLHGLKGRGKEFVAKAGKLLAVAIILDAVAQFLTLGNVWVWAAVVTGSLLIAIPYAAARGLTNRFMRTRAKHVRA